MSTRKYFVVVTFLFAASAFSAPKVISSYKGLVKALVSGHRVNAVADTSQCKVVDKKGANAIDPQDNWILGIGFNNNFSLKSNVLHNKTSIATIATNTITGSGFGDNGGDDRRYKRLAVFDDNTVEVYASVSDFNTGKLIAASTMTCQLSDQQVSRAVTLFDYDAD